ncbi:hypothetical protein H6G89_15605 [Oscillatoria sp. FACHB-1407]|uniref:hypothetical protein n=1 Tax=Oscillatoria sp. FACHB-1407 TaxID=2692847 RepID=UPI001683C946|nr:hypothetical protein [Oscillatoria sp. FACHB-1407]MBD2462471.1 hypothetical protein [Oscillatoria sp. FACHB-1407]
MAPRSKFPFQGYTVLSDRARGMSDKAPLSLDLPTKFFRLVRDETLHPGHGFTQMEDVPLPHL